MKQINTFAGISLAAALLVMQVGTVFAQDPTPIIGTVDSIVLETDAAGVTTVLVTVTDAAGLTQTVRLSAADAEILGLVSVDDVTGVVTVNDAAVGTTVEIAPELVIPDVVVDMHPVGSALADFFGPLLGVSYDEIMAYHTDGYGFGVIAQALYMANGLGGDSTTVNAVLLAKRTHDYSGVPLPDGSTAKNWGQLRKALIGKGQNLGQIRSGHATAPTPAPTASSSASHGHGNGNAHGHGKGHNK